MNAMTAKETLDRQFLEMRWRCLSLAADLDRIQRGDGSPQTVKDSRLDQFREAVKLLLSDSPNRAEQVQMIFSDKTPRPEP